MDSVLLFFSLCFPLAAGHDLVDYLPTEAYWKAKHVTVSGDAMLAQLQLQSQQADGAALVEQLGDPDFTKREQATQALIDAGPAVAADIERAMLSEDPEVVARAKRISKLLQHGNSELQVRQLMAVRTLGELRHEGALPVLKKLAANKKSPPFLTRYAQRAIDQIQQPAGATAPVRQLPEIPAADLLSDLALLPADSFGVLQVALREPIKMPLNPEVDLKPILGKGTPASFREPLYMAKLIAMADAAGNARIDSVTASLARPDKERAGYVTCVVRGEWDVAALRALLVTGGFQLSTEQGIDVATLESHYSVVLLSNQRMLVTFGSVLPSESIKHLLAGGDAAGLLRQNKRLWSLVETTARKPPIWGVLVSSEQLGEIPWLAPMQQLTLTAEQKQAELSVNVEVLSTDAKQTTAALAEFEKMLDKAVPEAGQIAFMFACAKPLAEMMDSLKSAQHPQGVTVTMQTSNIAPLLALPLVLTSNMWLK